MVSRYALPAARCIASRTMMLAATLTLLHCAGCSLMRGPADRNAATSGISIETLRMWLEQAQDGFEVNIRRATDELLNGQPSRRTQRLCLLWKMQIIPVARAALDQPDARRGMLDFWALCVRMEQYLTIGEGRELFGDQQAVAIAAAKQCTEDIESIVREVVPRDQYAQADADVDALAARFPIRGEFRTEIVRIASEKPNDLTFGLKQVLEMTLAPFDALKGVDRTAAAIREFTAVAARLTDVMRTLPEDTRMQTQLLALDLEQIETLQLAAKSMQSASESAARLAETAETLPQALRGELDAALAALEEKQGEIQKTLAETRATLKQLDESAKSVQATAESTAKAGDAWTGTVQAFQEMVASMRGPQNGASPQANTLHEATSQAAAVGGDVAVSPPRESRSFDINDYTKTAEALDAAARQLRELTREVRDLSGSKELAQTFRALNDRVDLFVGSTRSTAESTVDHLAWRAVQLVLFFFALAIIYRVVATRVIAGRKAGG